MKYFILTLFSLSCFSQNISTNKIDDFTGDHVITTSFSKGNKFKFSDAIDKEKSLFFSAGYYNTKSTGLEFYCITLMLSLHTQKTTCLSDNGSKAIFLFDDKSTFEFIYLSKTECGSSTLSGTFYAAKDKEDIENTKDNFIKLSTKNVSKIRIQTTEGYIDYEIKPEDTEWIKNHFKIILEEAQKA